MAGLVDRTRGIAVSSMLAAATGDPAARVRSSSRSTQDAESLSPYRMTARACGLLPLAGASVTTEIGILRFAGVCPGMSRTRVAVGSAEAMMRRRNRAPPPRLVLKAVRVEADRVASRMRPTHREHALQVCRVTMTGWCPVRLSGRCARFWRIGHSAVDSISTASKGSTRTTSASLRVQEHPSGASRRTPRGFGQPVEQPEVLNALSGVDSRLPRSVHPFRRG